MAKHTGLTKEKRPDQFWSTLKTLVDDEGIAKYKCLSDFALGCFTLPHANADCERCFSDINRVKTKDRNNLKVETLRDIILAKQSVGSPPDENCTTFKPSKIMIRKMTSANLYPTEKASADPDIYMEKRQNDH